MPPPAVTTQRERMPITATSPTFCAKPDWGKELKTGAAMVESMSARRPLAMRRESTLVRTIYPTAISLQ